MILSARVSGRRKGHASGDFQSGRAYRAQRIGTCNSRLSVDWTQARPPHPPIAACEDCRSTWLRAPIHVSSARKRRSRSALSLRFRTRTRNCTPGSRAPAKLCGSSRKTNVRRSRPYFLQQTPGRGVYVDREFKAADRRTRSRNTLIAIGVFPLWGKRTRQRGGSHTYGARHPIDSRYPEKRPLRAPHDIPP